jgi:hypothetical protein
MGAMMVFDAERQHVVLFGGWAIASSGQGATYPNDFWAWDGRVWRELVVPEGSARPSGRDAPHLAYDAARRRVVMFGGRRELPGDRVEILADTWEWDGARWHEVTNTGLEKVLHAVTAYDPVRRRVVMYGGFGDAGFSRKLREWDGTRWVTRDSTGPASLPGAAAMTPSGELIVMGISPTPDNAPVPPPAPHTWTFQASSWRTAEQGPPIANLQPTAGAPDGTLYVYQAWERWVSEPIMHVRHPDGEWTRITSATSPGVRTTVAAAYDAARKRMVLYGGRAGRSLLSDTWEFDGRTWEKR